MSVGALLVTALKDKPCRVFSSDLRVRVLATGLATYPDVSVVCGPLETDPENKNSVVNPTFLVEVLSESTESYDRNEKFEHYRQIPSLREYVLVSHRERRIDVWSRDCDGSWVERVGGRGDVVALPAISVVIAVDELYERSPLTKGL